MSENENKGLSIIPELNLDLIQQKANEAATNGTIKTIEEFYNGYGSPYRKALEDNLKSKGVDQNFDIPDIVAVLNEKLSAEVDQIANTAISKTFIPLVKQFLVREESEIKFSDILKKFIEATGFEYSNYDADEYSVQKVDRHSSSSLKDTFPTYQIYNGETGYELHFYAKSEGGIQSTTLMSLPPQQDKPGSGRYYDKTYESSNKMKLSLDGVTLELPFARGVLEDDFVSYCARLIIGNCNIIFDVEDFDEDMFPSRNSCNC